jgi:hypothetical protein
MNITEVKIMALMQERELVLAQSAAEDRIRRALAEQPRKAPRTNHGGVLRSAWQATRHALRNVWPWPAPRWDAGETRVITADELLIEV